MIRRNTHYLPGGVELSAAATPSSDTLLTGECLAFLARLEREFGGHRRALLAQRDATQHLLDAGMTPRFPEESAEIREGRWRCDPVPAEIAERKVELTGPPTRRALLDGLNSGANCYVADFDDASSPTWKNVVEGQMNICDAVERTIMATDDGGRRIRLVEAPAVLMLRPRGLHAEEKHLHVDGRAVSASIFDFGVFFFHNARRLLRKKSRPYCYLSKLENRAEARLWNDLFGMAEEELGIQHGTVRATVALESVLAAFEMDEMLYELRTRAAGLSCARWGYIFSAAKKLRHLEEWVLPDRQRLTMSSHFLRSLTALLVQTSHRRGTHAIGGSTAQHPLRGTWDDDAVARIRADKEREVDEGHDGTWVAHPGLVPLAMEVFGTRVAGPHQIHRKRDDVAVAPADLLEPPKGEITEEGVRSAIGIAVKYVGGWLLGVGTIGIERLLATAPTAEIARAQLWQYLHNPHAKLAGGRRISPELFQSWRDDEMEKIGSLVRGDGLRVYRLAAELLTTWATKRDFPDYFATSAYRYLE